MTRPTVLLLDVMGTLVHDPFHEVVPELFGLDLESYFAAKDHQAYLDFECGRIDGPTYMQRMFTDRRPVDAERLERHYRSTYRLLDGIEPLLLRLGRSSIRLHALSNYGAFWQWIEDELQLSRHVPWTFVSARTGLRKPDPACYLHAASALGVDPSACLFIDDREKNCAGARSVGMSAHRYTDTDDLIEALVRFQLL